VPKATYYQVIWKKLFIFSENVSDVEYKIKLTKILWLMCRVIDNFDQDYDRAVHLPIATELEFYYKRFFIE
jgi:hypothetical protein